ncbi:hypothetical protein [Agromyces humi]|uniref:hypothetical protein n=1 Tax=Agromyces humi TaxID=1766800 RepID=UPI00135AC1AC|nr:hypothetical protein [Agromyces humi]
MLGWDAAHWYYRYACEWCEHTTKRHRGWRAPERKMRRHERKKHRGQEKPAAALPVEMLQHEPVDLSTNTVRIGIPAQVDAAAEWAAVRAQAAEVERRRREEAQPDATALAAARSASYLKAAETIKRRQAEQAKRDAFAAERERLAALEAAGQVAA